MDSFDEWKLRKKFSTFCNVDEHCIEHCTANQIANLILEKLQEWRIEMELAAVILDSCTSS
jgi:hypothetical protein